MSDAGLKKRTFLSVAWTMVRVGFLQASTFVIFTVLARILTPVEFGMFALASLFVELGRILATAGLMDAILRARSIDDELIDTIFWTNVALSTALALLTWLLAEPYAQFMGQPEMAALLRWLALTLPLTALGAVHLVLKERDFGHKDLAVRVVASALTGGIAAIAAALYGLGAWSLVIQSAVTALVGLVLAWRAHPWIPGLRVSPRRLWTVTGFTSSVLLSQLLRFFLVRIQDLIIGRYINAGAVATYRIAWRCVDLISQATLVPIVSVSVVTLSRLQDDPQAFGNAYYRFLGTGALIGFPALLGYGFVAPDLIVTLFGPAWEPAGLPARILSLMAVPFVVNFFIGPVMTAKGHAAALAKVSALQFVMTLALSLAAVPFGLEAVAAAYVLRAYLTMPYQVALVIKATDITIGGMWRSIAPSLLASAVMVAALFAVETPIRAHVADAGIAYLATVVAIGASVYVASLILFGRSFVLAQIKVLRAMLGKTPSSPTAP